MTSALAGEDPDTTIPFRTGGGDMSRNHMSEADLGGYRQDYLYSPYSGSARRPKADVGYGGKTNTRNVHTPDGCIYEFLNAKFRNAKKYTRDKCRWSLRRMTRILEAGGFDASPFKIDEDAVNYIMDEYRARGKLDSYLEGEIAYLNRWITREDVMAVYEVLKKNQYGQYLKDVLDGKFLDTADLKNGGNKS